MKVHIILNSHLDPVWLWTWPQGLDEVLATARTACDILDDYPETIITRGEAWFYAMVQEHDPVLFKRIRSQVAAGRLQPVGGWWIQPDCNLPTAMSFLKHGDFAGEYFQQNLGVRPTVGYNVDSFGHAATLPDFYRAAGIDSYVMMRPQEHEMHLPSNLFTWESPSGQQLTTFRVSRAYCTTGETENIARNLEETLKDTDPKVGHTMCFVGVGDHGGGPARREIEWLREHRHYRPDVELVFSHPRAFFDAVKKSKVKLPVVKGELQHHSIGCYSVVHRMKSEMRRAEELIGQAEFMTARHPELVPAHTRENLDAAWKHILFNQFHDILAGSSIRSAYEQAWDELGAAKTTARQVLVHATRAMHRQLKPNPAQQLMFVNASDRPFNGYIEFEPWIGYLWAEPSKPAVWRLENEDGSLLPAQQNTPEAALPVFHLTTRVEIPAGGVKVVRIKHDRPDRIPAQVTAKKNQLTAGPLEVRTNAGGVSALNLDGRKFLQSALKVVAIDDPSDTWTHNQSSYGRKPAGTFTSDAAWNVRGNGPLAAFTSKEMMLDHSSLLWENKLYAGETILRLKLRLNWTGLHQIVKLIIPPAFKPEVRYYGIPGATLERRLNGEEYPIHNFLAVSGQDGALAVVSRDVFAADVQPNGTIRLTLLRSPYYAHHTPFVVVPGSTYPVCDRGEHEYQISLIPMKKWSPAAVEAEAYRQTQPVWFTESTLGCKRELL